MAAGQCDEGNPELRLLCQVTLGWVKLILKLTRTLAFLFVLFFERQGPR